MAARNAADVYAFDPMTFLLSSDIELDAVKALLTIDIYSFLEFLELVNY